MYRKKTRHYHKKHTHTDISSTDQDVYNIFETIRYNNKKVEDFSSSLAKILTEKELAISDLYYQGNTPLVFAAIHENEKIFQFLIENYKKELEHNLPQCIQYVYHNKNPNILKLALHHQGIPDTEFKNHIIPLVINHCYREENILIFKNWFEKYCSEDEISEITKSLITQRNKPFLLAICYDDYWKKQVLKVLPDVLTNVQSHQLNYFIHHICSSEHKHHKNEDTSSHIFNLSLLTNNITPSENVQHFHKETKTVKENLFHENQEKKKTIIKNTSSTEIEKPSPVIITKKKLKLASS